MARTRLGTTLVAVLCAFGLTIAAAACSSDSKSSDSGPNTASDVGVSADTIKIGVGVADLDGLRASGLQLAPVLTNKTLSKRVTSYFDEWNAAGGINGRKVEPVVLVWDPIKPTTQEKFCADATINNQLFAIIVASGLNAKTVKCVVDGGVPFYFGDVAADSAADTGLLLTVSPSSEKMAAAGAQAMVENKTVPAGQTIGILTSDYPEGQSGAKAAAAVFEKGGYKTKTVTVATMAGDVGASNAESAAAANTFKAAGISNVVTLMTFTTSSGYWNAVAGAGLTTTILDTASSNCTAYGAKSYSAAAVGSSCITVFGDNVTNDGKLATESDFEKACRAAFDTLSAATSDYPSKSYPGVPSGETVKLPDGTVVSSDYPPNECTLTNIMKKALEASGKNPTRAGFMKATFGLGAVPVALASNGKGTLKSGKAYVADFVHQVKLTAATDTTAKNATGTYNGCPVTKNCWVPTGTTWNAITY